MTQLFHEHWFRYKCFSMSSTSKTYYLNYYIFNMFYQFKTKKLKLVETDNKLF